MNNHITNNTIITSNYSMVVEDTIENMWTMDSVMSQIPFIFYFLASLQELPADIAVLRFTTCYILPFTLWNIFSYSYLLGFSACVGLWYTFTKPTPFSAIRIPNGLLQERIRGVMRADSFERFVGKTYEELVKEEAVNPFAVHAFVELVDPFVRGINQLEKVFGSKKYPERVIHTSKINWLFSQLNELDRFFFNTFGFNLLFHSNPAPLLKRIRDAQAPDLIKPRDNTEEALRYFFEDLKVRNKVISATGRLLLQNFVSGVIDPRECIIKYIKANPYVINIPIKKPLIIIGLPRTGSTFLHTLLAQDPNCRHLRMWESHIPIPPPREDKDSQNDPRIEMVDKGFFSAKIVDPTYIQEVSKHHSVIARGVEEQLMIVHGVGMLFSHYYLTGEGKFKEWYFRQDNKEFAYKYLRHFLQTISSRQAPRNHWLLKAPYETLFLEPLLKEFPDARIVVTHRHPRHVIPSWAQFQAQMLNIYTELGVDLSQEYANETFDMLSEMSKRLINFRKNHNDPDQFLDIYFDEITKQPVETAKKIYEHFGIELKSSTQEIFEKYVKEESEKKTMKSKAQKLSCKDLNISDEKIEEGFKEYLETYINGKDKS